MKHLVAFFLLFSVVSVYSQGGINTFPYVQSFENGDGGWRSTVVSGNSNTWALGPPAADVISRAADGQNAWVTNLSGPFAPPENSALVSPSFDFSNLSDDDASLLVEIWFELDDRFDDGVILEVSTDSGENWEILGANDPDFYNGEITTVVNNQFVNLPAWTGSSDEYVTVEADLSPYAGNPNVQFRFHLIGVVVLDRFVEIPEGFSVDLVRIQGQEISNELDQFFVDAFGEVNDIRVRLDQLGILPDIEFGDDSTRIVLNNAGFEIESLSSGIFYVGVPGTPSEDNLVQAYFTLQSLPLGRNTLTGYVVQAPQDNASPALMTTEIIIQFEENLPADAVDQVLNEIGGSLIFANPFVSNSMLVGIPQRTPLEALQFTQTLSERNEVEYAFPNFVNIVEIDRTVPNDPLFPDQWHLDNTGQGGGIVDADADLPEAWDLTEGDQNTIIAVVDAGFETTHPDLSPNLWTNTGEVAGDGIDNDGNGFIDDINGWDFRHSDNDPQPASFSDNHGTAVAGVAAARGDNDIGVSGSCPDCEWMALKLFTQGNSVSAATTDFNAGLAFDYARAMGATVITNSWGLTGGTTYPYTIPALDRATDDDISVLFSGRNSPTGDICAQDQIRVRENSFSVSSSDNFDRWNTSHRFGDCIDILAPTRGLEGTLGVTTTDRLGGSGYSGNDYTDSFGGTSSATPLVAGIVGLVRSVNTGLSRVEVQRLIQDTGDKIEDSTGDYDTRTGFSDPAAGPATHSFGRVNAFEAVRIAAPTADGGKDGVDVFIRDNRLDWGNTEQTSNTLFEAPRGFIGHWRSVDIKIDRSPFQPAPTNSAEFDAFIDEEPQAGQNNRVYVRIRNRGPITATDVTVKLMWTHWGTTVGNLPADFWVNFPADPFYPPPFPECMRFNTIGTQTVPTVPYSGATAARDAVMGGNPALDQAQILQFNNFNPPGASDCGGDNHFCITAIIDAAQDPVSSNSTSQFNMDLITPFDNNVTHRNIAVRGTRGALTIDERFLARNPFPEPIRFELISLASNADWDIELSGPGLNADNTITIPANDYALISVNVNFYEPDQRGTIAIQQRRLDTQPAQIVGGLVYEFSPEADDEAAPIEPVVTCPGNAAQGCTIKILVQLDLSGTDSLLGNFTGELQYNAGAIRPTGMVQLLSGYNGVINLDTANQRILFNGVHPDGRTGLIDILEVEFEVTGTTSSVGTVAANFSVLAAAGTFESLTGEALLSSNCSFEIVEPTLLGDVTGDGAVNSTDAAIILAYDAGETVPAIAGSLIAAGFGDINSDGNTNSFDALFILSYEVGFPVPYPIGEPYCPESQQNALTQEALVTQIRGAAMEVPILFESSEERAGLVEVPVYVDLSGTGEALGSYSGALQWDPAVYQLIEAKGGQTAGFEHPVINHALAQKGRLQFAHANPVGAEEMVHLLTFRFQRIRSGAEPQLELNFSSLATAQNFHTLKGITGNTKAAIRELSLQAFPNPFRERIQVLYQLPQDEIVEISVVNAAGQQLQILENGTKAAGVHRLQWDGTDVQARTLPAGMYLIRLKTDTKTIQQKVVLMR